jgi:hypothetical protein
VAAIDPGRRETVDHLRGAAWVIDDGEDAMGEMPN